jgi:hypothetical protein
VLPERRQFRAFGSSKLSDIEELSEEPPSQVFPLIFLLISVRNLCWPGHRYRIHDIHGVAHDELIYAMIWLSPTW